DLYQVFGGNEIAGMTSPVFAFGLVAFGFLGMGPVTIAVDSYGPVMDNAQSVYELSLIESVPNVKEEIKKDFGFEPNFERAKNFPGGNRPRPHPHHGPREAGPPRPPRGGRDHDVLLVPPGADGEAAPRPAQAADVFPPAVPARACRRRGDDLLVHRRHHPGGL